MEVEFQMSKKDYINFYTLYQKATLKKYITYLIFLGLLISIAVYEKQLVWWMSILLIAGCMIALISLLYFLPLLYVFIRMKKMVSNDQPYLSKIKYTITEDGLKSKILNIESIISWRSVTGMGTIEGFIFLKLPNSKLLIIPTNPFASSDEAANFLQQIQAYTKFR